MFQKILDIDLSAFSYDPQAAQNGTYSNNTTTPPYNNLQPEIKEYYVKNLYEEAGPRLVFSQLAQKVPIPRGNGKKLEMRTFDDLPDATTALTEGVTPDGRPLNVGTFELTVQQFGDFVTHTDLLDMTAIDPIIVQATKKLARQAASTIDTLDRNALIAGSNVSYASTWSGTTEAAVSARNGLNMTAILKVDTIMQAVAKLRANNAPTIKGDYVAFIHPYAAYDLMRDPEWIDSHKYAKPEELYKGELGQIAGVRFIGSSKCKIWKDSTCPYVIGNAGTRAAVFGTVIVGEDAYVTSEITGGGIDMFVEQLGSSGSADPLHQRATIGWKASHAAGILYPKYVVRLESVSPKYSEAAQAN